MVDDRDPALPALLIKVPISRPYHRPVFVDCGQNQSFVSPSYRRRSPTVPYPAYRQARRNASSSLDGVSRRDMHTTSTAPTHSDKEQEDPTQTAQDHRKPQVRLAPVWYTRCSALSVLSRSRRKQAHEGCSGQEAQFGTTKNCHKKGARVIHLVG